ncbi:MAG TPA: hypothetical protein VHG51_13145, partial [Longimicrobiaceae bacterium]|nr:hypothetical protein [Longimicrobiaceae bacterium]
MAPAWRRLRLAFGVLAMSSACAGVGPAGTSPSSGHGSERPAAGLRVAWTPAECAGAAEPARDLDRDGVADRCEHELAAAFAPLLVVDERECGWDPGLRRLGGEYLYAVQRRPSGGGMRIVYMPAYYRDCGWTLPVCIVTRWICRGHAGDSEAAVVDVAFDPAARRWTAERVFLSAHCHGRSAGRCRWYEGAELERFAWADGPPRGAPVVWVAHGKHGGYPTAAECDTGHWGYDGGRANRMAYRFPVVSPRQDAGSRARPFPHGRAADC